MLKLNDGRSELWQWDTNRNLTVDVECSQVHFSNKVFGRSIDVDVVDGVASIPDILLQTDKELTAWAFVGTPENGHTKISKVFKVNKRNKPADYVFTPPEQTTLGKLIERLDNIEESQDPDAIKNAVEDYLQNNPIHVDEKDPTVPAWAKEPNKPSYDKSEVGLGKVANERQYSASNPPPYPVSSVNGKTGAVTLDAAAVGARADTWMPSAADVGALTKSDLGGAVNEALAQAKGSGEFDGADGKDGEDGADGITPHIGANGNWFVGNTDTGKPSRGVEGQSGTSVTVSTVSESHASGGTNVVTFTDGKKVNIKNGNDGRTPEKGKDYFTEDDISDMVSSVVSALPVYKGEVAAE